MLCRNRSRFVKPTRGSGGSPANQRWTARTVGFGRDDTNVYLTVDKLAPEAGRPDRGTHPATSAIVAGPASPQGRALPISGPAAQSAPQPQAPQPYGASARHGIRTHVARNTAMIEPPKSHRQR